MSTIIDELLLEIDCTPAVKGPTPGEDPKVSQSGPIELNKAIAAIATRRKALTEAWKKLKELGQKVGTSHPLYVCQELRVKAAHGWLDFTTKRWKMMVELAKKKNPKGLSPHAQKLVAHGDVQHHHAVGHMAMAHTDQAEPPMIDVKTNLPGKLLNPDDSEFELTDEPHKHPVYGIKDDSKAQAPAGQSDAEVFKSAAAKVYPDANNLAVFQSKLLKTLHNQGHTQFAFDDKFQADAMAAWNEHMKAAEQPEPEAKPAEPEDGLKAVTLADLAKVGALDAFKNHAKMHAYDVIAGKGGITAHTHAIQSIYKEMGWKLPYDEVYDTIHDEVQKLHAEKAKGVEPKAGEPGSPLAGPQEVDLDKLSAVQYDQFASIAKEFAQQVAAGDKSVAGAAMDFAAKLATAGWKLPPTQAADLINHEKMKIKAAENAAKSKPTTQYKDLPPVTQQMLKDIAAEHNPTGENPGDDQAGNNSWEAFKQAAKQVVPDIDPDDFMSIYTSASKAPEKAAEPAETPSPKLDAALGTMMFQSPLKDKLKAAAIAVVKKGLTGDQAVNEFKLSAHPTFVPDHEINDILDAAKQDHGAPGEKKPKFPPLASIKSEVVAHWDELAATTTPNEYDFIKSAFNKIVKPQHGAGKPGFGYIYGIGFSDWATGVYHEWKKGYEAKAADLEAKAKASADDAKKTAAEPEAPEAGAGEAPSDAGPTAEPLAPEEPEEPSEIEPANLDDYDAEDQAKIKAIAADVVKEHKSGAHGVYDSINAQLDLKAKLAAAKLPLHANHLTTVYDSAAYQAFHAPPAPEAPPPVPEEPKGLSPEQSYKLNELMKKALLGNGEAALDMAQGHDIAKEVGVNFADVTAAFHQQKEELAKLSNAEIAHVGKLAKDTIQGSIVGGYSTPSAADTINLKKAVAASIGKIPSDTQISDALYSAFENAKPKAKNWSDLTDKEAEKVHAIAKKQALVGAKVSAEDGPSENGVSDEQIFKMLLNAQLTQAGFNLSPDAIDFLAQKTLSQHVNQDWDKLPPGKKDLVLGVISQALKQYGNDPDDIKQAIADAEIVHLTPESLDKAIQAGLAAANAAEASLTAAGQAQPGAPSSNHLDAEIASAALSLSFETQAAIKSIVQAQVAAGGTAADVVAKIQSGSKITISTSFANKLISAALKDKQGEPPAVAPLGEPNNLEKAIAGLASPDAGFGAEKANKVKDLALKWAAGEAPLQAKIDGLKADLQAFGLSTAEHGVAIGALEAALKDKAATAKGAPAAPPVAPAETPEKPAPPITELKTKVFAFWDKLAESGQPVNAPIYRNDATSQVIVPTLSGTTASSSFLSAYGLSLPDWLDQIWPEWFGGYQAKHPSVVAPAPPPTPPTPIDFTWTKFIKIFKFEHLMSKQRKYIDAKIDQWCKAGLHTNYIDVVTETTLKNLTEKLYKCFKADWASATNTKGQKFSQLSKPLIAQLVQDGVANFEKTQASSAAAGAAAPTPAAAPAPTPTAPAVQGPADYIALAAAVQPGSMGLDYKGNDNAAKFKSMTHDVYVVKKYKYTPFKPFASALQKSTYEKLLAKAMAALPPAPGVAPMATPPNPDTGSETPEVGPLPPKSAIKAGGLNPKDNPLGMDYEQIGKFCDLGKPDSVPAPPDWSAPWVGKTFFGGVSGVHQKQLLATDAKFNPTGKKSKAAGATHAWMFKPGDAPGDEYVAFGETAANRVQELAGLKVQPIFVHKGADGSTGSMQHFPLDPSLAELGYGKGSGKKAWAPGGVAHPEKLVQQLQTGDLMNWLFGEIDAHSENFVVAPNGDVTVIDHGQAGKFFDSSKSMLDHVQAGFNHTKPVNYKNGHEPAQDPAHSVAPQMFKDWASGNDVPMTALTDPAFLGVISRIEAIPTEHYQDLWKPYAESIANNKSASDIAGYSTQAKDHSVAGFIDGMNERRLKLRKDVGEAYAFLAKTRAAALKQKNNDPRPLAEIEAEVRAEIGLDKFLGAKSNPPVSADQKVVEEAAQPSQITTDWLDPKLPKMSQLPDDGLRKKQGVVGVDVMVGGKDVKDGRVQFYQLGDNTMATFMLDRQARKRLEAKLSGGSTSPVANLPPMPTPPSIGPFVPPAKPTFTDTAQDLYRKVLNASGTVQSHMITLPDGTQVKSTKLEKHLHQFKNGSTSEHSALYFTMSYKAAKEMAQSADPVEKAAGEHYAKELEKFGTPSPDGTMTLKDPSSVPVEDRKIDEFKPSKKVLEAQGKAKADIVVAHQKAAEAAKIAYDAQKDAAEADYKKKLKKWEKDKTKAEAQAAETGSLAATKLDYYPVPQCRPDSTKGKTSMGSEWDGSYGKSWDHDDHNNSMETYQLDLTDVVTGIAAAGGMVTPTSRLIVHYVPGHQEGKKRKFPGRGGTVRIQFPADSTKEQIAAYTQKVSQLLGTDMRPANEKDQELTYLRRMAWLRRIEGYSGSHGDGNVTNVDLNTHEPDGTTEQKIDWWIDQFKMPDPNHKHRGSLGYDPRYAVAKMASGAIKKNSAGAVLYLKNADGSVKRNPDYQPDAANMGGFRAAFRRFDISDAEFEKLVSGGGVSVSCCASDPARIARLGHQLSTERRAHVGLMAEKTPAWPHHPAGGDSSEIDVRSGGANEVYHHLSKGTKHETIDLDPRIMLYTSTWHQQGDQYGTKVDYSIGSVEHRSGSVQEDRLVEAIAKCAHDELLIGDRVSLWDWAISVKTGLAPVQRQQLIDELKAQGITHVGPSKKKIEDVIK